MSVELGDDFSAEVQLTVKEIVEAARFVGDENPIHHIANHDNQRIEGVIASGSHFSGLFSALVPSYFSKYGQVLGLSMGFQFRSPIYPDQTYNLNWKVISKKWDAKLNGNLYGLVGTVIGPNDIIAMTGEAKLVLYSSTPILTNFDE